MASRFPCQGKSDGCGCCHTAGGCPRTRGRQEERSAGPEQKPSPPRLSRPFRKSGLGQRPAPPRPAYSQGGRGRFRPVSTLQCKRETDSRALNHAVWGLFVTAAQPGEASPVRLRTALLGVAASSQSGRIVLYVVLRRTL